MKKKITLAIAFALVLCLSFAFSIMAAQKNIANQADITTNSGCWTVTGSLNALVDGNRENGCSSSHNEGSFTLNFRYTENMQFEKIVIVVNGKGSTSAGSFAEVTNHDFSIGVKMSDVSGNIVYENTHKTKDLTEIVIVPEAPVNLIAITVSCGWNNKLPIWEVEAYGSTVHNCTYELTNTKTPATCGEDGEGDYICTFCDKEKTDIIPATGNHSWDNGTETVKPSETTPGVKTYTCGTCGNTKTEDLAPIGHNWDSGTEVEPSCTEKGCLLFKCTDAGCTATYRINEVDPTGHEYDEGVITKHSSLVTPGEKTFTCSKCSDTYTEELPLATMVDNTFTVGLDQIYSVSESLKGAPSEKRDWQKLFDGNTANSSWSQSNPGGWWAPNGSSITITFNEELYVLSVKFYVWSNYNAATIEFFDEQGNVVATYARGDVSETGGGSIAIDCADKLVKSMKITVNGAKGDTGNCLDFQEFVILAHEHQAEGETAKYDEIKPSCETGGMYSKYCYVCEKEVYVYSPSLGGHQWEDTYSYANGYASEGKKDSYCPQCDYSADPVSAPALVVDYGYSFSEATGSIAFKFGINRDLIQIYGEAKELTFSFGVFAVAKTNVESDPLTVEGGVVSAVNNKVLLKPLESTDYGYVEYSITGIPQSHYDTKFILRGYIYDGASLAYVGDETVSYNR
ncbi:MAG: hypothetical protein IJ039_03615 [Clostridia bacterium]|nr:hypothetical protein [Clostridia bacterium]